MLVYHQFYPLKQKLLDMGINLNTVSNSEHIPKVESQNQVLE